MQQSTHESQGNGSNPPYIPSATRLPEITIKALVLGVVLSAVLAGANAYLGLFAGMTVSASIPAAVISMAILKFFRNSNILENNIVQTSASAGESLAAGVIFTIPAMVLLGSWAGFNYWETTMIAGFGGLLGVLFTIPLRRALIVENPLTFPEGIATAEVLKAGEQGGSGVMYLAWAGVISALFKFGETGLRFWKGAVETATYVGGTIAYVGTNASPALLAVGYIVGLNIAVLIFVGGALNWWIAIPILAKMQGVPEGVTAVEAAGEMWSSQTRYLGVGAMVVGGLWALIRLRRSLVDGIRWGMEAYRRMRSSGGGNVDRTEQDTPMQWVGVALIVSLLPLFMIFWYFTKDFWVSAVMAVLMMVAGFLFSAVAAYMAGLVGSSNNPISGVTIATILTSALLLFAMLGSDSPIGPAAAILIGGVVCCAAAIAGDNLQDLKAGRLVGATPYKQQIMQGVGVISAAFVMAPVLTLLHKAYGIGIAVRPGTEPLAAPQATLMASVAKGVFSQDLPWPMVITGMLVAVAIIVGDLWLEKRGSSFRMPVLAVAVGIYLPLELEVPIFAGGLIAWAVGRFYTDAQRQAPADARARVTEVRKIGERNGLLFSAGLITGEALVGIAMAVPIVLAGKADVLAMFGTKDFDLPGVVLLIGVIVCLYWVSVREGRDLTRSSGG